MPAQSPLSSDLREQFETDSSRLRCDFAATANGLAYLRARTDLVDSVALRLAKQSLAPEHQNLKNVILVATGDFGRRSLFPYSDIDLALLLLAPEDAPLWQDGVEQLSKAMTGLGLKLNLQTKSLPELGSFDSENVESILSLLDCRFLLGDEQLFSAVREEFIPEIVARESQTLAERLAEMTRTRHRKFASTVFHLEPNVNEGPGGYRDYVLAYWLAAMSAMEKKRAWPNSAALLPAALRKTMDDAFAFLAAVRCFLHFRHRRGDDILGWDDQKDAAAQKIGTPAADPLNATEWMRVYFEHARSIERISGQQLEEMPAAQSLFYRQLETWRTGFSDTDFSVVDGLIFFQKHDRISHPELFFRTFQLIAQRGFKLSPTAELQLEKARPELAGRLTDGAAIWRFLQDLLPEAHAADALRSMHSLHLLTMVLPEFQGIDALAVRDVSHRFTVDEHTLQGVENLHGLRQSKSKWDERYAGILDELDQPELLYLAILLHDTGKALAIQEHVPQSLSVAKTCLQRLHLPEADRETVLFLIERHLDMAATLRRDIFDPSTVAQFAESIGSPDRLKMLCLFTYADIKAVNPEALTPWKAEDLWQLYIGSANYLNRTVDERVRADANDEVLNHLRSLAPAAASLQKFLEGLPRRYVRTHPVDEILRHLEMANRLGQDSVQLALKRSRHWYELTVLTKDRPFLFATVAGVLAACGMNIGKAAAFSNAGGTVVDTFYFTDRFRRLEMNLPEWERFKGTVHDALSGKQDMYRLLRERLLMEKDAPVPTSPQETRIQFDDTCSPHSTLIEVIAHDQPGLLYRISSVFSQQKCDIDIALIDTEGHTAIDVFYLATGGGKLTPEQQAQLRAELLKELAG